MEKETEKAIKELREKRYIKESNSSWANDIRPVLKPNGKVRITTNLIGLNNLVELDRYSLPNMEHLVNNLHVKIRFSKLNLKDGFFQIQHRKEDQHKTASRYKHRIYQWTVMPMGFKNSPAVFQRFMDKILRKEIGKSCWFYVDNILIFGESKDELIEATGRMKDLLLGANMISNENKSSYC